ncbi:VIT1/CCC1 transporter family protein, partial [Corynebacterium stationis]|uniref:VIT1/CCC1 transporter family protein n=3 Tax=Corynebacterium TaxID=1716 RepID=UPI0026F33F41
METMEQPTRQQIARWRKYLANERAEAAVYRELARKKKGEERDILLKLADAESRHEQYWQEKLGEYVGMPQKPDLNTQFMGWMAKNFGSVFTLALMQSAESRTPYLDDEDASEQLAADERVHAEVVRGLAIQGREKISGSFRAAVFGANDGLVSNLALVIGVMGSGAPTSTLLLTGVSGLLAGALSMAAGEYVSVKSQGELLEASRPAAPATQLAGELDVDANELALIYRARGMSHDEAEAKAQTVFHALQERTAAADASSHAHA